MTRRALCLSAMSGWIVSSSAQSGSNLEYQSRDKGRYKEGRRSRPSTGVPLDLIAAMVDYREPYTQLPPQFQSLVYLPPRADDVHLTIREVEPEYYYWLDSAQPEGGWQAGRVNRFQWPTQTVIRQMTYEYRPLALSDLGALVRLGGESPRNPDEVVPAALFHTRPPASATGYRFVFRPGLPVHLTLTVSSDGTGQRVGKPQDFPEIGGNEAQAVLWKTDGWADGWYRIAVNGYSLSNNTRVDSAIRFYHRGTLA